MATHKKLAKFFILVILVVMVLSTGLVSVMYLGGKNTSSQNPDTTIESTGLDLSGNSLSGTDFSGNNE